MRKRLADLRQLAFDFFGAAVPGLEPNQPPARSQTARPAIDSIASAPPIAPPIALTDALPAAHFAHPQANRQIALPTCTVAYRFDRARRRSIGFAINADGLTVRAPRWVPVGEVESALRAKGAWIARKLAEARERQQRHVAARIDWRDGATLPLYGEPVRIALGGAATALDAAGTTLHVALPPAAGEAQLRDAVQAWLKAEARRHFTARLDHFAPLLGVRWARLALSNAGTRWGSAKSDGSIRLHWRLLHFRAAVIDYVVAHELAHLRVMDHSPRFWDTVATVVPDHAALRGELRQHEVLPAL